MIEVGSYSVLQCVIDKRRIIGADDFDLDLNEVGPWLDQFECPACCPELLIIVNGITPRAYRYIWFTPRRCARFTSPTCR
jgi:hypothetical protein